jgi:putative copper resistance protein D
LNVRWISAGALALAASLAWMVVEALSMVDAPPVEALQAIGGIATGTAFGRAWAVATAALAAALAIARASRFRIIPLRTLALLLVLMAIAHASAGHAGADGFDWRLPAMAVHLLATGLWAGGVFAATLVTMGGPPDPVDAARYARRLSALATAALAGVVATGAGIAWHELGGSAAPLLPANGSAWGLTLDAKLALVAIAVVLGGFNRFVTMRSLPDAWPRFARVLRVEAVVLLAALAAAAWLANGEPPAP